MDLQNFSHPLYYYVSSKAAHDPCKTIYLCPPAAQAGTLKAARQFALASGWQDLAEEREAVLVIPVVPDADLEYNVKNRDIPVHLWIFQKESCKLWEEAGYFSGCYGECTKSRITVQGLQGEVTVSKTNPAWQTRVFFGNFCFEDRQLNNMILAQCFEHVIRWKNSPDGTLALVDSKEEFYKDPRFLHRKVTVSGIDYDYFVHLPEGRTKKQLQGLPLVFTVHGRGEPAWLFTGKNGWDTLADETGEFILVSPDSPGNIWFLPRDCMVFPQIVYDMEIEFGIDVSRDMKCLLHLSSAIKTRLPAPKMIPWLNPWLPPTAAPAWKQQKETGFPWFLIKTQMDRPW